MRCLSWKLGSKYMPVLLYQGFESTLQPAGAIEAWFLFWLFSRHGVWFVIVGYVHFVIIWFDGSVQKLVTVLCYVLRELVNGRYKAQSVFRECSRAGVSPVYARLCRGVGSRLVVYDRRRSKGVGPL